METVSNIASAASRAIWGEPEDPSKTTAANETAGQEPLNGQTGNVRAGEPYDKGNIEPALIPATDTTTPLTTETNDPLATSKTGNTLLSYENLTSNPKQDTTSSATNGITTKTTSTPEPSSTDTSTIPKHEIDSKTESPFSAINIDKVTQEDGKKTIGSSLGTSAIATSSEPKLAGSGISSTENASNSTHTSPPLTNRPEELSTKPTPIEPVDTTGSVEKILKENPPSAAAGGEDAKEASTTTPAQKAATSSTKASSSSKLKKEESPDGTKEKKSLKEKIKEKLHKH